jgi:hypothetical protein
MDVAGLQVPVLAQGQSVEVVLYLLGMNVRLDCYQGIFACAFVQQGTSSWQCLGGCGLNPKP